MKKEVLVTLANENYVNKARQLFSSAYHNGGWTGDFLLLSENIPKKELEWFKKKGIQIKEVPKISSDNIGHLSGTVASKFHLFTDYFKKWQNVVFLDADIIVKNSLDSLKNVKNLSAAKGYEPTLKDNFKNLYNFEDKAKQFEEKYDANSTAFNSGVMAFNTDIIKKDTFSNLIKLYKKYKPYLSKGEQGILNLEFQKRWDILPQVYNFYPRYSKINPKKIKTINLHFIGPENKKPWNKENQFRQEWAQNLKRANTINLNKKPKDIYKLTEEEEEKYSKFSEYLKSTTHIKFNSKTKSDSISNLSTALSLAKFNFKTKINETKLGLLWTIIEPLAILTAMYFVFKERLGSDISLYPLYLLSGIVMIRFFLFTTRQSVSAYSQQSEKISKTTKSPHVLIESIVLKNLFIHIIDIIILTVFILVLTKNVIPLLFYPIILVFYTIFLYGFSLILFSLNSIVKDTERIWFIISRMLWFITPVFYVFKEGSLLEKINLFNPAYYFIDLTRNFVLDQTIPAINILIGSLAFSILALVIGTFVYNKLIEQIKYKLEKSTDNQKSRASLFYESLDQ